jgi:hypothetical protein
LQALLAIEPTHPLHVDPPAFTPKKHVNPPIAIIKLNKTVVEAAPIVRIPVDPI